MNTQLAGDIQIVFQVRARSGLRPHRTEEQRDALPTSGEEVAIRVLGQGPGLTEFKTKRIDQQPSPIIGTSHY